MSRLILYFPKSTKNDATTHYLSLVKKAFLENKFEVVEYDKNNFDIVKNDFVFVIRIKDFINVFKRNRKVKIIVWFQGVEPEEHMMRNPFGFKVKMKFYLFNYLEKIVLRNSYYNFFVSTRMKVHYQQKHGYNGENNIIIPCYNKKLSKKNFQFPKPDGSYVYAGSLYSWQCFKQTILVFKEIEKQNATACLTVLTKDIKEAEKLLNDSLVKNFNVFYVELENLEKELAKHKYGFMLRENHIVNNVSTPTKMNTYLSAGLIPIYTNVINSFESNLNLDSFEVKINLKHTVDINANKINEHDSVNIDYEKFYSICKQNFSEYYDDFYNVNLITTKLISKIIVGENTITNL